MVPYAQGFSPVDPATGLGTGDTAQDFKGNYGINWGTSAVRSGRIRCGTSRPKRTGRVMPGPFENPKVAGKCWRFLRASR